MKTPTKLLQLVFATLLLSTVSPAAQSADAPGDRYEISPVEGGIMRLDKKTGEMSICRPGINKAWSCQSLEATPESTIPKSDTAGDSPSIAELKDENRELRDRIKVLEDMLDDVARGEDTPSQPGAADKPLTLPSDDDVEKALDFVENLFKQLRDRVRKYDKELEDEQSPPKQDEFPGEKKSL